MKEVSDITVILLATVLLVDNVPEIKGTAGNVSLLSTDYSVNFRTF
jgi:hypothetical protein